MIYTELRDDSKPDAAVPAVQVHRLCGHVQLQGSRFLPVSCAEHFLTAQVLGKEASMKHKVHTTNLEINEFPRCKRGVPPGCYRCHISVIDL
ncbi:hypothetical protein Mapa_015127 [Marchantia paleacea]|nr:hypothetical protein Mapa_015127 [Marchantia paleacea]